MSRFLLVGVVQELTDAAAVAGKLARLTGATYPAALLRTAAVFAGGVALAAAVTSALATAVS
ncbi:hypothetical protein OG756_39905 [Streptomyces sp. NBC_01310]|uniref:hypothetical protein n=1 Tax=Streptomyces sp. NBC_01310 TaxID=2903820 RepID=UPI0035B5938C|nr:hypothetical protein OG756_39905 [Streptomyces sp. NBC_01310]